MTTTPAISLFSVKKIATTSTTNELVAARYPLEWQGNPDHPDRVRWRDQCFKARELLLQVGAIPDSLAAQGHLLRMAVHVALEQLGGDYTSWDHREKIFASEPHRLLPAFEVGVAAVSQWQAGQMECS